MNDSTRLSANFCLCCLVIFLAVGAVAAQEMPEGPPKILVINREMLKPGRNGAVHAKTESAFVQALSAAKSPAHYFAAESMSGQPRALFFHPYASFADWEKENMAVSRNPTLAAALDRANYADGEELSEYHSGVYVYRPDDSLRAGGIVHMRYFQITQFHIRPGHHAEWEELLKMYMTEYGKAVPSANWAVYESMFGTDNGGLYVAIRAMSSLAELDQDEADDKKFAAAMGADGMKKMAETSASCIASEQTNLFHFSPQMSYPWEEWIKADPFWKIAPSK